QTCALPIYRVQLSFGREPFDGADVRAGFPVPIGNFNRQNAARVRGLTVYDDSACAASAAIANLFRAGEIEMVAQSIEQSDAWLNGQLFLLAVDAQGHGRRAGANYFAGAQNRIGQVCRGGRQLVTREELRGG